MHGVPEHARSGLGLGHPVRRDLGAQRRQDHLAGVGVLHPVKEPPRHAEARRHHAARVAGVDPLGDGRDPEVAVDVAAQGGAQPHPLVVSRAAVEAHHEPRRPDAPLEVVHVSGEVRAPALLAGLDQADAARVWRALILQRFKSAEGSEHGVPIVRRPATVELAVLDHGLPGTLVLIPAGHLGLLVQVAIHEDRAAVRAGRHAKGGHLHEQRRRQALEADDLDGHTRELPLAAPGGRQLDRVVQEAVGRPVRVEGR